MKSKREIKNKIKNLNQRLNILEIMLKHHDNPKCISVWKLTKLEITFCNRDIKTLTEILLSK